MLHQKLADVTHDLVGVEIEERAIAMMREAGNPRLSLARASVLGDILLCRRSKSETMALVSTGIWRMSAEYVRKQASLALLPSDISSASNNRNFRGSEMGLDPEKRALEDPAIDLRPAF